MKLRKQAALLAAFIIVSIGLWGCGGGGGGGGGTQGATIQGQALLPAGYQDIAARPAPFLPDRLLALLRLTEVAEAACSAPPSGYIALKNATVTVSGMASHTETDSNGCFTICSVPAGVRKVTVSKDNSLDGTTVLEYVQNVAGSGTANIQVTTVSTVATLVYEDLKDQGVSDSEINFAALYDRAEEAAEEDPASTTQLVLDAADPNNDVTLDDVDTDIVIGPNTAPTISGIAATKSVILSNNSDSTTITVNATDANSDRLTYTWAKNGGTLSGSSSTQKTFTTNAPGEFTITVKVSDGWGGTATETKTITSFGDSVDQGGVKGSINVTVSGAGKQAGPGATRSILSAPVTISSSRGEAVRKSYYGHKGLPVTTCKGNEFMPGELIVKLKPVKSRESFAKAEGLKIKGDIGPKMFLTGVSVSGLKGASALDRTRQACIEMNERPDVEFADLNHIMKKMSVTPNDANFGLQWHYNLINIPQAWEITTGSNSVIVAVLDTGIIPGHADLAGRLISGYDFVSDIPTACDGNGRDADPEDRADSTCASGAIPTNSPEHSGYHGTHVAGTIGAATNNTIGVAGVTWSTKIMPVRVLGAGGGTDSDIMAGMYYAARIGASPLPAQAANIINMSIGGDPELGCAYGYATVFSDLHDAGVLVFVAAGNEESTDKINPLAQCEYAMAVAAVNRSAEKAWYSNAGPGVDIAAPGGDTTYTESDGIYSTVRDDNGNIDTSYGYMQGTSMATPHAAGVAALIMAAGTSLSVDQVANIMTNTATVLPNDTNHYKYGAGLINAYAAALEAQGGTPSGDPEIAVSTTNLYFSQYDTAKTVIITNTGGGDLLISSVTTDVVTGDWLDGSYQAGTGKFTLTITVDRTGLAGGRYDGTVTIASNGGADVVVQVAMQVNTPEPGAPPACGPGDDSNIYILAVDADFNSVGQTDITVSGGEFMMFEVPQSSSGYYIIAGTDCSGEGLICETGDYCGTYPLEDSPVPVEVDGQVFSEGVDFSVREVSGGTALSKMIGARGFKLLHR